MPEINHYPPQKNRYLVASGHGGLRISVGRTGYLCGLPDPQVFVP